ncbi:MULTISPECIES: phage protease [unclassified Serratia (in: enterobacteria)]|uniref:phage protease n=1 Tax=unclassified Serratia (in: enterobacteria) TaxID=2647522 RepID=UPI0004689132|nr:MULTISPECIES: phage protease [unclassified Serratia (in: enterobacteria)]
MNKNIAIASLALEITSGNVIQLFPAGKFRSGDIRPEECAHWLMDGTIAKRVIAKLAQRKNPIVIDYEHQTYHTEQNGEPAPAAGWWSGKNTAWREGVGLFAEGVEWTEKAAAHIAAKEYRFISPVFAYDASTGEVLAVANAALTNHPALDGMAPVQLAAARAYLTQVNPDEDPAMDELLKILRKLLGLPEDASEQDILSALQAIEAETAPPAEGSAAATALLALLKANKEEITALKTAVVAATAKTTVPAVVDPSKYVPVAVVTDLQTQMAALTQRLNGGDINEIIAAALASGHLIPAMEPWARDLGAKDVAMLRDYIKNAAPLALLTQQNGGIPPTGGDNHGLTATELNVARLSGLTPEDFAKAKADMPGAQQ